MRNAILHIASQLHAVYPSDEAEALAWWIAEEMSGLSRTELQFGCKDTTFLRNTQNIIDRLLQFEPIQYIFGHTLWNGLDLKVTSATLIPRPETAELVERINISSPFREKSELGLNVLDIGTGSGCIAIALKKAHPEWRVTGIDFSPQAIEVAKENARGNNVEVEFHVADIFSDEIEHLGTFDIALSNPPYVCEREKKDMRPNVLNYEPASALFVPDNDPLLFYRRISSLHLGKYLYFEINESFAFETKELLGKEGYIDIKIAKDFYGKDRFIEGRMAK